MTTVHRVRISEVSRESCTYAVMMTQYTFFSVGSGTGLADASTRCGRRF